MNYEGKFIKVLSQEHGKKVLEWWKSKGINTGRQWGDAVGWYYGIDKEGYFNCYSYLPEGCTEITLPNEYPKEMWVWDDFDGIKQRRVVQLEIEVKSRKFYLSENYVNNNLLCWKFAEDIEPIPIPTLTIAEAEAKLKELGHEFKIKTN